MTIYIDDPRWRLLPKLERAGWNPISVSHKLTSVGIEHDRDEYRLSPTFMRGYWLGWWDIDFSPFMFLCRNLLKMTNSDISAMIKL